MTNKTIKNGEWKNTKECKTCEGEGTITFTTKGKNNKITADLFGILEDTQDCQDCEGDGYTLTGIQNG